MIFPLGHRLCAVAALALLFAACRNADWDSPGERSLGTDEHGPYRSEGLDRRGLKSADVRQAMSRVPRHLFVPEEIAPEAYSDRALPIGSGQTISQPYIVALMTENARIARGAKVLEVGTGSGFQAAVLAEVGARVFSVEIVPELAVHATRLLQQLGYADRVAVREGDGWKGWPEEAPFDAIMITASAPRVPEQLITQLKDGGRMILPLENEDGVGERLVVFKRQGAEMRSVDLGSVRFVPLTGEARYH